jgi:hypothetical protein
MLPVRRDRFHISADQVVALMLVAAALEFAHAYLTTEPIRTFNRYGLGTWAAGFLAAIAAAFVVARIQRSMRGMTALLVVFWSLAPLGLLLFAGSKWLAGMAAWEAGPVDAMVLARGLWLGLLAWLVVVSLRVVRLLYDVTWRRSLLLAGAYVGVAMAPVLGLPEAPLWYSMSEPEEAAAAAPRIDVEEAYYAQARLVGEAAGGLRGNRPGVVDLYFVGFAGTAYQDVFLREVRSVTELFDRRFDTAGRSVMLINNPQTLDTLPLASVNNLRRALDAIGRLMDPQEDVLFLFLTSHGSRDHRLAVDFWPLRLNYLPAGQLKKLLDESGIKWRVVVVSACYSGGFIKALKDDHSLIMTASRADRNSFGCSQRNAFTHFGRAYFDRQLRRTHSFIEAFAKSQIAIQEREADENLTPSMPQIHIGRQIEAKLRQLERRIQALPSPATAPADDQSGATP